VTRVALRALRRIAVAIAMLLAIVSASWAALALLPGDPVRAYVGPQASAKDVEHARRLFGLDEPKHVQYAHYMRRFMHASADPPGKGEHASCKTLGFGIHVDLGYSPLFRRPVLDVLEKRAPASFKIACIAVVFQLFFGVGLGIAAALRRGKPFDRIAVSSMLLFASAPTFVVGLLLQDLFARRLGVFPLDGYGKTPAEQWWSATLPGIVVGLYASALMMRVARDEMVRALDRGFVRTARAKGARAARVYVVHALRAALLPLLALSILDFGALLGGAMVVEKLFRIPGIGDMAITALQNRDAPTVMGSVIVSAAAAIFSTLLVDLAALWLDPRQRGRDAA
jgi:peptide/nickel transport system permease protein